MSEQEHSNTNKTQLKQEIKQKLPEQQKKDKQPDNTKLNSNQFSYYVPHQSKKLSVNSKQVHQESDKSKQNSRQRSREKNQRRQQKNFRNYDDQSSHRNDRYERNQRQRRSGHQSRSNNEIFLKQQAYKKTKLCPQMQRVTYLNTQGQCRKGSDCNFAHSQSELRGLPDFRKTKLCIAFKEGKCGKLSSECKYAHGQAELRRTPKVSHQRDQRRQRSPHRKQKYHSVKPVEYNYPIPPSAASYLPYQSYMTSSYTTPNQGSHLNQYSTPRNISPYSVPGRIFGEYPPPPNTTMGLGSYAGYVPPPSSTGGFYLPPTYDYYSHYPSHIPPQSAANGYGYPGPKPPM